MGALRGLDGFEGRSRLRTWVLRIVANIAGSWGVRDQRVTPFSSTVRLVGRLEKTDLPARAKLMAAFQDWEDQRALSRRRTGRHPCLCCPKPSSASLRLNCGRSSMVELQPSKLVMRVRFPSPARGKRPVHGTIMTLKRDIRRIRRGMRRFLTPISLV